jgi:hypothetical protein
MNSILFTTITIICFALLLLVSCGGVDTQVPATSEDKNLEEEEILSPPVPDSTSATATLTDVPRKEATPTRSTADSKATEDLEAIDTVVEEIDNQVCLKALETRAEIQKLLQEGQDVTDLLGAMDELIKELGGCDLTQSPE